MVFENIPNLGYLILNSDGSIIKSGGDLENDEKNANIIYDLITLTESIDPQLFPKNAFQKISIIYEEHYYTICLSNKKIHIIKRRNPPDFRSEQNNFSMA